MLVSVLYANSGTRIIETCKNNNESKEIKTQQLTHVDLFNVDVSGNSNDDQTCECTTMEILGFELFESIILTLVFVGLIFAGYKIIVNSKQFILKLREKRALAENRKFEKMRLQYEKTGRRSARLAGTVQLIPTHAQKIRRWAPRRIWDKWRLNSNMKATKTTSNRI